MRLLLFSSKQCIIKQLSDLVFVISQIIKVLVSVLSLRLPLMTLTSTLIIPDITKTHLLYNNQINARPLIGQSAVGYCTRKPMEKSHVFRVIV